MDVARYSYPLKTKFLVVERSASFLEQELFPLLDGAD